MSFAGSGETHRRRGLIELPPGYSSQPAWGFELGTGKLLCELNRVYGPSGRAEATVPVRVLDEALCYWGVTLPPRGEHRWLSYAGAKDLLTSGLTFGQFCSLSYMGPKLEALLLGPREGE